MASTLSVVLPNYNHARYIGRALEALLAQQRAADEIIVVDDGSTDDSASVIETFAARAPAIKVLRNRNNLGVIASLQRGLEAAIGDNVYFAAADDYILPGFFEVALRRIDDNPNLGLFCGEAVLLNASTDRVFAARPAVRPRIRSGRIEASRVEALLRTTDNWILTGSAVFRRECVLWAGGFDARLGSFADGFLARKIALKFGFFFEARIVATWMVSPESESRQTARKLPRAQRILDIVPTRISADPVFPTWYAQAFRDRWRFAICRLALEATPIDRELLLTMATDTAAERDELDKILALPRLFARLAILARLWYRLRPTALNALLRTALARRVARQRTRFRARQLCGTSTPVRSGRT